MDIKGLLKELVEVEYVSIRVELYIKPTDDIKSKLLSGLILNDNLIVAYKEKIKGMRKYYYDCDYLDEFIPSEYTIKIKNIVETDIKYIESINSCLETKEDIDKIAQLINTEQETYNKIIHNNNIIMNNLAEQYLKMEHEEEDVLETNVLIEESNINNDNIKYNNQEAKTTYTEHKDVSNVDIKNLYLFQISEIEKAIAEIDGKGEKTRKDINELYQYHNEILKIRAALAQL